MGSGHRGVNKLSRWPSWWQCHRYLRRTDLSCPLTLLVQATHTVNSRARLDTRAACRLVEGVPQPSHGPFAPNTPRDLLVNVLDPVLLACPPCLLLPPTPRVISFSYPIPWAFSPLLVSLRPDTSVYPSGPARCLPTACFLSLFSRCQPPSSLLGVSPSAGACPEHMTCPGPTATSPPPRRMVCSWGTLQREQPLFSSESRPSSRPSSRATAVKFPQLRSPCLYCSRCSVLTPCYSTCDSLDFVSSVCVRLSGEEMSF